MISPGGLTATLFHHTPVLGSRYWRTYQASNTRGNSSGYEWHLCDYQMLGANFAATVANTTASSIRGGAGLTIDNFFGNASVSFGIFANYTAGESLTTDFGSPRIITTVKYRSYSGAWAPTLVWVQSSDDGTNWITRTVHTDNNTSSLQTIVIV